MSISGILSSALSGLRLNADKIGASADNIANISTDGYKSTSLTATSVVTGQSSGSGYASGGVRGVTRTSVSVQGLLQSTGQITDLAISGNGFFAVDPVPGDGANEVRYTRAGSFTPDSDGRLINAAGGALLAYPTGQNGTISSDTLEVINLDRISGTASATTTIEFGANLPADAALGDTFTVNVGVYDSLGNQLAVTLEFEKKAANVFSLTVSDPSDPKTGLVVGETHQQTGVGPAYSVDVIFDAKGKLEGYDTDGDGDIDSDHAPGIYISKLSSKAEDLTINLDTGGKGAGGNLVQYSGGFQVDRIYADGASFGNVSGVSISNDGLVTAKFDNGEQRAIYSIPVITFQNPEGLASFSGNYYGETDASGAAIVQTGGQGGAGTIRQSSLEGSNVDLGNEFVQTILARTAYKASLKVLDVGQDLADELVNIRS